MAHGLHKHDDMVWLGETPWHTLGEQIFAPMTINEAKEHRLMAWKVEKAPVYLGNGDLVPSCHAIVRGDTMDVLGTVGDRYQIVQNDQVLDILAPVVDGGEGVIHTMGNLWGGKSVWALVKLPESVDVTGHGDVSDSYLLLTTTHDGSGKVRARFTKTRVVCQNTLTAALGGKVKHEVALRHTTNVHDRLAQAAQVMGMAHRYHAQLDEAMKSLANKPMTATETYGYINTVLEDVFKSSQEGKTKTRAKNILDKVYALVEEGKGADLPGVRGTAWGALNVITEYVDHHKGYHNPDTAFFNIALGGEGSKVKERALEVALAY